MPDRVEVHDGCFVEASHERGDRMIFCEHGRAWAVRASAVTAVIYTATETRADLRPKEADGA